jgi:hypothetical protein
MHHFTAHRLWILAEAQETVELNEHQGSAIRGAFFHALRGHFCFRREATECALCPLSAACPVAFLVSTLDPQSARGRDVPRPFTIQPPLPGSGHAVELPDGRRVYHYRPGETLRFGLTLYARAMQLLPYVVLALTETERGGLGRRTRQNDGRWRQGRVRIREARAENPLTGERRPVLRAGETTAQVPDLPITHDQVLEWIRTHPLGRRLTLEFLTPTRLIEDGRLVKPHRFRFRPLFQRLMERLEALTRHFSDTPLVFDDPRGLIAAAEGVRVVENRLTWEEVTSYSTRRRAESPTSGLLGTVVLEADDWSPFLPWLVWGQFTHVGKDAVKGKGWYRVEGGG